MATKKMNWIPVRRGTIYCSPGCGAGCTIEAFDLATRRANDLAAHLGTGWKPRVWENLGWHYEVARGLLSVSAHHHGKTSYTAMLGNRSPLQWFAHGETADAALAALKEKVLNDVTELQEGMMFLHLELTDGEKLLTGAGRVSGESE